jgi:hypothetical protein
MGRAWQQVPDFVGGRPTDNSTALWSKNKDQQLTIVYDDATDNE